jgi:hypothetical protein
MATIEWLPKDILRMILKEYLDLRYAVMCLRYLSIFRRCLSAEQIKSYQVSYREHKRFNKLKDEAAPSYGNFQDRCELCNGRFKHKFYMKHMKRRHFKKGIDFEHPRKKKCELCETHYPPRDHFGEENEIWVYPQRCRMQKVSCGPIYQRTSIKSVICRRLCKKDYRQTFYNHTHSFEFECIECHYKWADASMRYCENCCRGTIGILKQIGTVFLAFGTIVTMLRSIG